MNLKKTRKTINILATATVLFMLLLYVFENTLFFALALASVAAIVVINVRFWRCPYCEKILGRDVKHYCTHCGRELDI